ncbi:MAG: ABC transporter substrate-binding protein [Chromatiales bacterium]|nr:ABC transporter substrate-binding protein [Chromatiales bacterium]
MKLVIGASLILAGSLTAAHAAECGKVSIADMNWNSGSMMAHIDRFILEHGYGCDAELVPGDTMPTGTSMVEKGEPDIAPEFWSNSLKDAIEKGVKENRLKVAGKSLSDGGEEGFWVPKYLVDKDPSLATIAGIKANAKMFKHPEDPNKAAFWGCPAGWNCQISNTNLFKALELEKSGFELIDPGSGAALSGSIAKAYEREKPWFGYYWAPTAVLGKYQMVKVDFGSGTDPEHHISCITQVECENPKVTMYPPSPVHTITTIEFADRAPEAFNYLSKRAFKNDQMNILLAWMEENQADGEIAMEHFLKNYPDDWAAWVSSDVAEKIKSALKRL